MTTTNPVAQGHDKTVMETLANIGWGRTFDLAHYAEWPGEEPEEMVRRACKRLEDDHLVIPHKLPETPGEVAYMLTDLGDRRARDLGMKIIGRSHDLKIGKRWHEHVMAIAMATAMRRHGYTFYFARQVKWAIRLLKSAKSRDSSHLPDLLALGVHRLEKFPDGVLLRTATADKPAAAELEWAEKKGAPAADQVISCPGAKREGINVLIGYAYPPDCQKALLERRERYSKSKNAKRDGKRNAHRPAKKRAKAIDHEGCIVRNFYARATSSEDLTHIRLMRMYFDARLCYQRHELVPLIELAPKFRQAIGTSAATNAKYPDWSDLTELLQNGLVVGYDFRHIPSGCWLRIKWSEPDGSNLWSGWTLRAWMEYQAGKNLPLQVHYPTLHPTHEKDIQQEPRERWLADKAVREAKKWYFQEREKHLAKLGKR